MKRVVKKTAGVLAAVALLSAGTALAAGPGYGACRTAAAWTGTPCRYEDVNRDGVCDLCGGACGGQGFADADGVCDWGDSACPNGTGACGHGIRMAGTGLRSGRCR